MNNLPLISVYILCFNHEQYVLQAINSILQQTYKNWELIIVDNGSTDNSKLIIEQLLTDDSRIKFYSLEHNLFPSAGSNYAIKKCSGEYIVPLAADDCFELDKLEKQFKFMQANSLDLSFTWVNLIDSNNEQYTGDVTSYFNVLNCVNYIDILTAYLQGRNPTCATTAMVKKSLYDQYLYDHRLLQAQDLELWIVFCIITNRVAILPECLTNYRVLNNSGNLSINKSLKTQNRSFFELVHISTLFLSLDIKNLSKALSLNITQDSLIKQLYEYFEKNDYNIGMLAILISIFNKLDRYCDTLGPLYQFFLEKYAEYDFNNSQIIVWLEEQNKGHVYAIDNAKDYIEKLNNNFSTLVAEYNELKNNYELISEENRNLKELHNKNIRLNHENIELNDKNIELNNKNIELNNKNIELNNKNIELNNNNVELNNENIELKNDNVELNNKNIELKNDNVELNNSVYFLSNKLERIISNKIFKFMNLIFRIIK